MSWRHLRPAVLVLSGIALLATFAVLSDEAEASHFWSGTLQWERIVPDAPTGGAEPVVKVTGYLGFDTTYRFLNCAALVPGAVVPGDGVNWGFLTVDGVALNYNLIVEYVDPNPVPTGHCRFAARIVDPVSLDGVVVPVGLTPAVVEWGKGPGGAYHFCCRENNGHINNPNIAAFMGTVIPPLVPNESPVIDFAHLTRITSHGAKAYGNHHCPANAICKFYVEASDPDNDTLSWRLATNAETGGAFEHPDFFSIDKNTGLATWDTNAAGAKKDKIYSTQIIVEDGVTSVPVDFMIEIGPGCENGATGVVDPVTGELICVFEPEPPEPTEECEVNPDGDGCRPVPPKPSKGQGYAHKFWPPGRHVVPLEPTVSGSEPVFSSQNDDVDASLSGLDSDGDSIDDSLDKCHGVESVGIDTDGDGQDDACDEDDDNDGILDEMDACRTDADTFCSLEQEGKDPTEQEQDASRGFFSPAEAVAPGSGSAAVQGIEAASGVFATAFLGLLAAAFILLLVVGRRRRT